MIGDSDTNTVSLRREIAVVDVNDNPPEFLGRPYSFSVSEDTQVGTIIYRNITVVDRDIGLNGEISMTCVQNNEPCVTFNLLTEKVSSARVEQAVCCILLCYKLCRFSKMSTMAFSKQIVTSQYNLI